MFYTNQTPKLIDCNKHGVSFGTELFVVEGDSASQAVAKQRDARFQAVLPMQGKPMNPMRASQERLLQNTWYAALIDAVGTGLGALCKPEKRRYERIIILMDPDADGIHCGALITLFFYQWMRPLLDAGAIYMVRPPVGQSYDLATQTLEFAYSESGFRKMLMQKQAERHGALKYRGLAGIPNDSLEALCVNPKTRRQLLLTAKDAAMAMKIFN